MGRIEFEVSRACRRFLEIARGIVPLKKVLGTQRNPSGRPIRILEGARTGDQR